MKHQARHKVPGYKATGHERLQRLADFLDGLPPGKLTFSRWYGDGRGCAVGLAAIQDPWFRAQGLCLENADCLKDCRPVYDGRTDWQAVVAFFEMDLADVRELFTERGYERNLRPHPRQVAEKIRLYLSREEQAATRAREVVLA